MELPWEIVKYWMSAREAVEWRSKLYKNLNWIRPQVKVFGSNHIVPRLTTFLSSPGITYTYSGFKHSGLLWPCWFLPLLNKVNQFTGQDFNGCLINLYRDGNDCMGWHSDNEIELDKQKSIVSLSLGSTRDLKFKHQTLKINHKIKLMNGDLLIMKPECQYYWLHSLPIRRRIKSSRINLTFRCYL